MSLGANLEVGVELPLALVAVLGVPVATLHDLHALREEGGELLPDRVELEPGEHVVVEDGFAVVGGRWGVQGVGGGPPVAPADADVLQVEADVVQVAMPAAVSGSKEEREGEKKRLVLRV